MDDSKINLFNSGPLLLDIFHQTNLLLNLIP